MPAATALVRRARGTIVVLRTIPRQRGIPFLPRDEIRRRRDHALRELLRFAMREVPHYRDARAEINTADDLAALPLLDKATVQSDPVRFRPARLPDALVLRTSGSTAMPLEIVHDRRSALANIAYGERERAVEAAAVGDARFAAVEIRAPAGTGRRVQDFYDEATFRPRRRAARRLEVGAPLEDVLEAIDRLRPALVRGYGTYLELLFRWALAHRKTFHRPRAILYSGDTMSPAGHDLFDRLGIRVLSRFNAVECFKIAYTCEAGRGFHVHEDLCHVRLVDGRGRDVAPGERGEVVITNLVNRGTVLVNYRLGDLARLDEAPCPCGRTSPRLVDLEGRVDDVVVLGDGRFVYPTEIWQAFRQSPELLRYQLVQLAPSDFELRYVAAADTGPALDGLRRLLSGARLTAARVDELPADPGGKFRHVVPLESDPAGKR